MGSVWVTAGLSGPVLGGIKYFHWLLFWVNVPVARGAMAQQPQLNVCMNASTSST